MLKIYIDGVYKPNVGGVDSWKEVYYFNEPIFSYMTEISGEIVFFGDDFNELREMAKTNICQHFTVKIEDAAANRVLFDGRALVADVQFNITKMMARIEITDSGIMGFIDNNKKIELALDVPTSKNGEQLPTMSTFITGLVDPQSTSAVTDRRGYNLFDVLNHAIRFMSDNQLQCASDFFDPSIGDPDEIQKNVGIYTGQELRQGGGVSFATINYEDFINDINSLYNIAAAFERIDDVNYLRIEQKQYFKQTNQNSFGFDDVDEINQQTDENLFRTNVVFGSNESTPSFDYLEDTTFLSHNNQTLHLGGQCNLNNEFLLNTTLLVYDTNVIQRVLPASVDGENDDGFDDDVFILSTFDGISGRFATLTELPYTYSPPLGGFFNATFSPFNVSNRWFGDIPMPLFSYLGGTGNNDAEATNTNTQGIYSPNTNPSYQQFILFPDEISDPSNSFDTTTIPNPVQTPAISHYTVPVGGLYTINYTGQFIGIFRYIFVIVFDPSGTTSYFVPGFDVFIEGTPTNWWPSASIPPITESQSTNGLIDTNFSVVVPAQQNSNICIYMPSADGDIQNANLEVLSNVSGRFQEYWFNDTEYAISQFTYPIATLDRELIFASPYTRFLFNSGKYKNFGYLQKMERSLQTGESSIELRGKL